MKRKNETLVHYTDSNQIEELLEKVRRQAERIAVLGEVTAVVASSSDFNQLFEKLAAKVKRVVDFDRIGIAVPAIDSESLRVYVTDPREGANLTRGAEIPTVGSAAGWVIENRRPLVEPRLPSAEPFYEEQRLFEEGIRSMIFLPALSRFSSR